MGLNIILYLIFIGSQTQWNHEKPVGLWIHGMSSSAFRVTYELISQYLKGSPLLNPENVTYVIRIDSWSVLGWSMNQSWTRFEMNPKRYTISNLSNLVTRSIQWYVQLVDASVSADTRIFIFHYTSHFYWSNCAVLHINCNSRQTMRFKYTGNMQCIRNWISANLEKWQDMEVL